LQIIGTKNQEAGQFLDPNAEDEEDDDYDEEVDENELDEDEDSSDLLSD